MCVRISMPVLKYRFTYFKENRNIPISIVCALNLYPNEMGKNKKGFNWKARQVINTDIDNSKTKKISVDLKNVRSDCYDQCNALVIPSKKRKTKKKTEKVTVTRILSKAQRKRLEKIVDQKKKKENHSALLAALAEVQVSPNELSQLTSITTQQTQGLKRQHQQDREERHVVSSVAGSAKRRRLLALQQGQSVTDDVDPSIVGLQESSDEESSDEEQAEEHVEQQCVSIEDGQNISKSCSDALEVEDEPLDGSNTTRESHSCDCTSDNPQNDKQEQSCKNQQLQAEQKEDLKKGATKQTLVLKNSVTDMKVSYKPAVFVPVQRTAEVETARLQLPILAEEQSIMEAVSESNVVVLAGETGSGKTTQVPQFLFEAGYASNGRLIGVTEPRRVAAVAMSKRVAHEMNLDGSVVSYLIRFEGNTTDQTKIKFMTDGVLLKEIQSDLLLRRYSAVLLDEAHERSVYTDILLGLLSRTVPLRARRGDPLKLIIMSATLRLDDFVHNPRLFRSPPPVVKVDSRQFPVTIHFNKRTNVDYLTEVFSKTCKIHKQLPDGGILVFLTGQQEVNSLVRRLRHAFPCHNIGHRREVKVSEEKINKRKSLEVPLPSIDLDEFPVVAEEDSEDEEQAPPGALWAGQPLWVLPLYSLLPAREQSKVFESVPTGCRLCVVATNVAETSLTIPNVKYVVDSGRVKTRQYDRLTGVSAFSITWTSKAAANQRAGRAGRVGPGHCYRLYSSAIFNDEFPEFSEPEVQRKPVDDLMLQMKAMGITKVVNFPFPSPPALMQLQAAERRLTLLGALEPPPSKDTEDWASEVTSLGNSMAAFPVAPRFGKMLALSQQHGLLPYTVCLVAALSVPEVLLPQQSSTPWARTRRSWAGTGHALLLGDPMVLLRAVGASEHAGLQGDLESFCQQHGLRHKAVREVRHLRLQLTSEVNAAIPDVDLAVDPGMPPPTDAQARQLRQLVLAGMADQVARRVDPDELKDEEEKLKWKHAYRCAELEEPVRIHSSSVLRRQLPPWVVYQEVFETNHLYMRGITAVEPEWLPVYVPALCNLSTPLTDPPPRYETGTERLLCHVTGTFGRAGWQLPVMEIDFPVGVDRYRWFARFLLEGVVCPKLQQYRPTLLSTPATMIKTWASLQPRTDALLRTLAARKVDCKSKLLAAWQEDTTYLLEAYQKWLPESAHNELALMWPPI